MWFWYCDVWDLIANPRRAHLNARRRDLKCISITVLPLGWREARAARDVAKSKRDTFSVLRIGLLGLYVTDIYWDMIPNRCFGDQPMIKAGARNSLFGGHFGWRFALMPCNIAGKQQQQQTTNNCGSHRTGIVCETSQIRIIIAKESDVVFLCLQRKRARVLSADSFRLNLFAAMCGGFIKYNELEIEHLCWWLLGFGGQTKWRGRVRWCLFNYVYFQCYCRAIVILFCVYGEFSVFFFYIFAILFTEFASYLKESCLADSG